MTIDQYTDKDSVLEAVKNNGYALEHASKTLRKDLEVIKAAVTKDSWALQFAIFDENEQTAYIEIVTDAVTDSGYTLRYASEELKNNPKIVEAAVKNYGMALGYASKELRNNPEIVEAAVTKDGLVLQYASDGLKNNLEIVKAAVTNNSRALKYASDGLKENSEIVEAAKERNAEELNT